jgi:predicted enzyme related to lactoylglutathione lyase
MLESAETRLSTEITKGAAMSRTSQSPERAKSAASKPKVVQFEITGRDGPGLQRFYTSLFGWEFRELSPNYGRSSASETGLPSAVGPTRSGPNRDRPADWDGGPGQVTVYVEVDDVDAYVARAIELGGRVVAPPHAVANRDLMIAFVADSEGHVIGLAKGLQHAMERLGLTEPAQR